MTYRFPENYNIYTDPTFRLAVEGQITLKPPPTSGEEPKTLTDQNVLKLSGLTTEELERYDVQALGQWNLNLISYVAYIHSADVGVPDEFQKIITSFANMGILMVPMCGLTGTPI